MIVIPPPFADNLTVSSKVFQANNSDNTRLCITGPLWAETTFVMGGIPSQMASNAEMVSMLWCFNIKCHSLSTPYYFREVAAKITRGTRCMWFIFVYITSGRCALQMLMDMILTDIQQCYVNVANISGMWWQWWLGKIPLCLPQIRSLLSAQNMPHFIALCFPSGWFLRDATRPGM